MVNPRPSFPLTCTWLIVEDRIRCGKDTGLGRLPSREFAINQAWCTAAAIAVDLTRWLQLLGLHGDLALAEPKRLRYRVLHTAARLTRGATPTRQPAIQPARNPTSSTSNDEIRRAALRRQTPE